MVISPIKFPFLGRSFLRFSVYLVAACFFVFIHSANAQEQITIKGAVYNMNHTKPLQSVSVLSTSGRGTVTDSNGNYTITLHESDSISFSYLGRQTIKYPVKMINAYNNFDIALHVEPTELKTVRVAPRDYHMDSLQNRQDYAKYFDYKKPGLKLTDGSGGTGVGLDLDEIINAFRFNRNRRLTAFQHRLVTDEHEKFIDHRFSHPLVRKITKLNGTELDAFMIKYRPSYIFTQTSSDYDFDEYIKLAFLEYKASKKAEAAQKKAF